MELQLAELVGELCEALPEASLAQLDALTVQAEAVEEQVAILKVGGGCANSDMSCALSCPPLPTAASYLDLT
jgi:hypothetical protein